MFVLSSCYVFGGLDVLFVSSCVLCLGVDFDVCAFA